MAEAPLELPPLESPLDALLVNARIAARLLGISPRTLWALTTTGELPCARIGRRVLYDPADLRAWRDARKTVGVQA